MEPDFDFMVVTLRFIYLTSRCSFPSAVQQTLHECVHNLGPHKLKRLQKMKMFALGLIPSPELRASLFKADLSQTHPHHMQLLLPSHLVHTQLVGMDLGERSSWHRQTDRESGLPLSKQTNLSARILTIAVLPLLSATARHSVVAAGDRHHASS